MSPYSICITLGLALLGSAYAQQETPQAAPAPAVQAAPAPVYSCDDQALEDKLADLKELAGQTAPAAARQIYVQYAVAGRTEVAKAWAARYIEMLTDKAEQGDVDSMAELGLQYLMGKDYTAQDIEKGVKWLYRAAEAGNARSAFILGDYFARNNNPAGSADAYGKAYAVYSKAAAEGDTTALYWQGLMQQNGYGTEKNPAEGIAKLEQAAEKNQTWAMQQLYVTYAKGLGVPEDMGRAIAYARKAADAANDGMMAYATAIAYLTGNGVEQDATTGETYLDKAVAANIPDAIWYKASRLEQSGHVAEAYPYYRQGASMGHPACMVAEGRYLLYGMGGVEKDESRGLSLMQTASDRWDNRFAPYELAKYYDSVGEPEMANNWYYKASERGIRDAFARRGLLHLSPFSGVEWSPTRTYQWWRLGKDAGDPTCTRYINLYLYCFLPLLLILVFGVPIFTVHFLNKRAEKAEEAESAEK